MAPLPQQCGCVAWVLAGRQLCPLLHHLYVCFLTSALSFQFVGTIADNMNAEIVLGTMQNIRDAATWLGYT